MRRRGNSRDPQDGSPVGIDDWSGFKVALKDLKKEWDGLYTVDPDIRNFQDFVKGVPDNMALPFARPEAPDVFVTTALVSETGIPLYAEDGTTQLFSEGFEVSIG